MEQKICVFDWEISIACLPKYHFQLWFYYFKNKKICKSHVWADIHSIPTKAKYEEKMNFFSFVCKMREFAHFYDVIDIKQFVDNDDYYQDKCDWPSFVWCFIKIRFWYDAIWILFKIGDIYLTEPSIVLSSDWTVTFFDMRQNREITKKNTFSLHEGSFKYIF